MVSLVRRKKGNGKYYYLRHNVRKNGRQKELYLGKRIPPNVDELKRELLTEFYREEWLPLLEKVHQGYTRERNRMPKVALEKDLETFSINFTYNTQRIEGSTLTLRETADLLVEGRAPSNKPMRDVREAEAHQRLFFEVLKYEGDLSLQIVKLWHNRLFGETRTGIAGKVRDYDVRIRGSRFIPPSERAVSLLLKGFFDWYSKNKRQLNPVELSALVHLEFVTIHPFGDGNGRLSRLMMNYVLAKNGYPLLDISYTDGRSYYNALERAQLSQNDIVFLKWFMKRYLLSYKRFL